MKKETLVNIIVGTIGGLLFSLGMCMCLIPAWSLFNEGCIVAIVGFILLLVLLIMYESKHKRERKPINWTIFFLYFIGIVGSSTMGFGMSRVSQNDLIVGIVCGIIGLLICILNYPVYLYIKSNYKK